MSLDSTATVNIDSASSAIFTNGSNSHGLPRLRVFYTSTRNGNHYTVNADLYIEAYDFFGSCLEGSSFTIGGSTKTFSGSITGGTKSYIAKRLICTYSANVYSNTFSISAYWKWNGTYSGQSVTSVSGSVTVSLPPLEIIPSSPSASSISFNNTNNVLYNGYYTYSGMKTDMINRNTFTISGNAGNNGVVTGIEINKSTNKTDWTTWISESNNSTTISKTFNINNDQRDLYFRWRITNTSSTGNLVAGSWRYFRINKLPIISGSITEVKADANIHYPNILFDGAILKLPTISDIEEAVANCSMELFYRKKILSTDSWGVWTSLGEYSSGATTKKIVIEDYINVGQFIQFGIIASDSLEYNPNISVVSNTYQRNNLYPTAPLIMNIEEGSKIIDSVIPLISGENYDYKNYPEIFEITYQVDNGLFYATDLEAITSTVSLYNGRTSITGYSTHTIKAVAKNKINGLITNGTIINFKIIKSQKPVPVILGVVEGGTYLQATPTLKPDVNISTYEAYLNNIPYKMGTLITTKGTYTIKVIATHSESGEFGETQVTFSIDSLLPDPIEVYGVIEGDIKANYSINIIKQLNSDMIITMNDIVINAGNGIYNSKNSYLFNVINNGTYKLDITATHKTSGQTRTFTINKFVVQKGDLSGDLIRFKNDIGPVNSAQTILNSGNPIINNVEYTIDNTTQRYSSPVLIFENEDVIGKETNKANESYTEKKKYNGFIPYIPELPTILNTGEGRIHNTPVLINFTNNATKPTQAMYKIFIDGDEIVNPFNNTTTVIKDGYHYITILGWDNVNPYNYQYKTMRFLIKAQDVKTIRKPYIISYDNKKDSFVDVRIKFSDIDSNFKHSILITEIDGTSILENYAYNVKTVSLSIKNNCTILAKTELVESNLSRTTTKIINTIFDTIPLSNIKLYGVNKYNFLLNGITSSYKIGKKCYLDIERRYNEEYEIYINGMTYNIGDLLENRTEEIRKYTVEVIIKNTVKNLTSYFSDTFYLDSINPAQPILMNMESNLMTRTSLPKNLTLKNDNNMSSEEAILNNQIINVHTNLISKDNEYILTVTYIYYNGAKRANSFYFSINSNPIDELNPSRVILKILDYKKDSIAKEGELLVDRESGHIYYKEGTIKPITKNIEEEILIIEKQLIKVELNHEIIQSNKFFLDEMTTYIKSKQIEFNSRLDGFKSLLDTIKVNIDNTLNAINMLENNVNGLDGIIQGYITNITVNRANSIKSLTTSTKKLNDDFIILSNELKNVFHRAAICTEETYKLKDEINTRVLKTDFDIFKANENTKYNNFITTKNSRRGGL